MTTDRRLLPANGRVAARYLQGEVQADAYVDGRPGGVAVSVANLCAAPAGARDRQVLYGEPLTVYEQRDGWAFVQSSRDGYVGYIEEAALGPLISTTHRVAAPATHLFSAPDIKRPEAMWLSFGAQLRVVSASGEFFETDQGLFVPKPHLRPLKVAFADPVTVAQMHFGVPYLWGGNSSAGIDCSGLVQAALLAAGLPCPGDSDLQERALGTALPDGTSPQRGDLLFWKGHVAMVVEDDILIHANAFHMAVSYEPISAATARISEQGGGPVTAHKRIT